MKISISGIRGIFNQDLLLHDVLRFSRGFSKIINKECVLARDTRKSSKIISETVAAALMAEGIDVYNLGIAPTSFAFREARKHGAAIIVTASHNPLEWNGLKFVIDGRGIFEDELEKIKNEAINEVIAVGKEYSKSSDYEKDILNLIDKMEESRKVALDTAGGAASKYANTILSSIGCAVTSINDEYGESTRTPDPTTDELTDLRNTVTSNKCDIGFAFDLDGDRLVLIDKNGVKMKPDVTLLLCIAKAIDMGIKEFVVSVDTSKAIEEYVKEKNCKLYRSKVGEANVVKEMIDHNIPAGGEGSSGGFILKDFNMCRDGMLASAFITGLLGTKTYEECIELAKQYHSARGKIEADSNLHSKIIESITNVLKKETSSVDNMDGVLATLDDNSQILIRGSNTEHIIRLSVESKDEERSKSLYSEYEKKIREAYETNRKAGN